MKFHLPTCLVLLGVTLGFRLHAQPASRPAPDAWLEGGTYPGFVSSNHWSQAASGILTNEVLIGKLRVYWHPPTGSEPKAVRLWSSADQPGRWQARDWRPLLMVKRGERWEAALPVENVDVPVIYFVETGNLPAHTTAMRLCHPRLAGLEEPSRIFWPFLEGFEEELWSWRKVTDEPRYLPVDTGGIVKNGRVSLRITVPPGKHSATVSTTRIRGWQLDQNFANGIRLWVRTDGATARLRCTLQTHAFTEAQKTSVYPEEPVLSSNWQPMDLMLNRFTGLNISEVDLLSLEVIGNGPLDVYVDDVQLLGRWPVVD